jgi:hypothetical protein
MADAEVMNDGPRADSWTVDRSGTELSPVDICAGCGPATVCVQRILVSTPSCPVVSTTCLPTALSCPAGSCSQDCRDALCGKPHPYGLADGGYVLVQDLCDPQAQCAAFEVPTAFHCYGFY